MTAGGGRGVRWPAEAGFYDFPAEHWRHLRNVDRFKIEDRLAGKVHGNIRFEAHGGSGKHSTPHIQINVWRKGTKHKPFGHSWYEPK